jgi:2-dehydro-3-deoxyphosphooctonate aldolase (KDO 8-P synthase)
MSFEISQSIKLTDDITVGDGNRFLIAGPCAAESYDICHQVAETLISICRKLNIQYIFKASFDKANRTSVNSFRGPGLEDGLAIFEKLKTALKVPILTDIHETVQVSDIASIVDVLQIPAFLCRQTDLIIEAANSGKGLNIKRGQFMAPEDMKYAVEKAQSTGNKNICLTERGSSYGYHNLVVDFRSLPVMRQFSPVIFDVTHSVQQPGSVGGASGGQKEFAPYLAKAAKAVGVDGFFIETHPNPSAALSDGPNMIPLNEMEEFLKSIF